jgi:hypothetical protein
MNDYFLTDKIMKWICLNCYYNKQVNKAIQEVRLHGNNYICKKCLQIVWKSLFDNGK